MESFNLKMLEGAKSIGAGAATIAIYPPYGRLLGLQRGFCTDKALTLNSVIEEWETIKGEGAQHQVWTGPLLQAISKDNKKVWTLPYRSIRT